MSQSAVVPEQVCLQQSFELWDCQIVVFEKVMNSTGVALPFRNTDRRRSRVTLNSTRRRVGRAESSLAH